MNLLSLPVLITFFLISISCCSNKFLAPVSYFFVWINDIIFHVFSWIFIYLFEREIEKKRNIFLLLVHSLVGGNSHGWARWQPGAWDALLVSTVGSTWTIFCLSRLSNRLGWKWRLPFMNFLVDIELFIAVGSTMSILASSTCLKFSADIASEIEMHSFKQQC